MNCRLPSRALHEWVNISRPPKENNLQSFTLERRIFFTCFRAQLDMREESHQFHTELGYEENRWINSLLNQL